jgi:acyl-CoA reductase-like NAD-dependent aldehyde dehydrogenase
LAFTIVEPIGIVAAISAFNHPPQSDRPSGRASDCRRLPVIVKPAPMTPLSCIDFVGLLHEAGLPPHWCQTFLPETDELAEALVTDPRISFLSLLKRTPDNVRYLGQSGEHILPTSFTARDPFLTFGTADRRDRQV